MARARNLKPQFFTDDKLAELPPLARILFAGLWCIADRAGRLEDRPKRIKAEVLPYDNVNVDRFLTALADAGFIVRYAVGEARYIEVRRFSRHQNPHVKEPPSTIPAPDSGSANPVSEPGEHSFSPASLLIPDSGFRIPPSGFSPLESGADAGTATPATSDREKLVLSALQVKGLRAKPGDSTVLGWLQVYSDDLIQRGIDRAAQFKNGGGLNLGYVSSILADPSWRSADRMRDMLAELGIDEDWENSDDGVCAAAKVLRMTALTRGAGAVTTAECKRRLRDELRRRLKGQENASRGA